MANRATILLILILIAACGYNWVQIRNLQEQVAGLRTQLAVARDLNGPVSHPYAAQPDASNNAFAAEDAQVTKLNRLADSHYAAYKKDVSQSDLVGAAKELESYVGDKRAALRIQQTEAEQSVSTLRKLVGSVSDETGLDSSSRTPPQTGSGI